jgi:hypothetical protein
MWLMAWLSIVDNTVVPVLRQRCWYVAYDHVENTRYIFLVFLKLMSESNRQYAVLSVQSRYSLNYCFNLLESWCICGSHLIHQYHL